MDNRIGAVATNVVKGIDLALAVARYYEVEVCNLEVEPIPGVGDPVLVCDKLPPAGEDGALLELIQLGRCVPLCWECANRCFLLLGLGLGLGAA